MDVKIEASTSDRLKQAMEMKNMKQADLVRATGIDKGSISLYVSGKYSPKGDKLYKLATALGVSSAWLSGFNVSINDTPIETSNLNIISQNLYNTPIFESVSAGFGVAAIDSVVDYIPLPYNCKTEADETICIRVKGDSMSPKIEDGDLIQVHKQSSVDSGDIAVVLLDGSEGLVKKVVYDAEYIQLISINPYYPVMEFKGADVLRVSVVGKVKKIIRDL